MTDLAREIEELPFLGCDCGLAREHLWHCPSLLRSAILAYVQRKLDEQLADHQRIEGEQFEYWSMRLDEAKADGELLAKVETLLRGNIASLVVYKNAITGDIGADLVGVDETLCEAQAPTLVEALRKLVESDS